MHANVALISYRHLTDGGGWAVPPRNNQPPVRHGPRATKGNNRIPIVLCMLFAPFAAACGDGTGDRRTTGTDRPTMDTQLDSLETRGSLAVGQSIDATLTVTDPTFQVGGTRRGVAWEMAVDSGQQVQVDMMSDAFNPFLYILGPGMASTLTDDNGGGLQDASLCFRAPGAGAYRVVTAAVGSGTGDYSVSALDGCDGIPGRFRQLEPRGALVVGQSVTATLTDTDFPIQSAQNRRAVAWDLDMESGQQVQVELESEAFDPFLYIVGPGMPGPLEDDDSGEGLGARLCLRAPDSGTYRIIASGPEGGGIGDYSVSALDGCLTAARLNQLDSRGTLAIGQSVAATIESTVPPVDGRQAEAWQIQADSGQQVQVELMSDAFDPYLYILGPGMAYSLTDDDGGSGADARICFQAPESNTYRVVAAARDGGVGDYYLLSARHGCGGTSARPGLLNIRGVLDLDESITATLGASDLLVDPVRGVALTDADRLVVDGPRAVGWEIWLGGGSDVQIDMMSDAFDPFLNILDSGMTSLMTDDDGGISMDAHLCFRAADSALHKVVAAARGGGVGTYSLSAREGCDGIPARLRPLEPRGALAFDRLISATLTDDDLGAGLGHFAAGWNVRLERGREVRIDMMSDAFDPFFYIVGPGMASRYSDDDGGDAGLCVRAPESGTYRVVAAADADADRVGDYRLLARAGCDGIPARLAGVEARGVLGIGESVDDVLTTADFSIEPGGNRRGGAWELELRRGQEVLIEMVSEALNPFLYIVGPGMAGPLTDDDGGLGWNARLCFRARDSGAHKVVAAALDGGVGDYALSVLDGCPVG